MSPRLKNLAQILGRWGVAFFVLLALDVVLAYLAPGSGLRVLVALSLYVSGLLFVLQLIRRNMRRLIWRLRNRLIVAYLFIAFVPIVLIVILVAIGGYMLAGQTSVYLVSSELDRRLHAHYPALQVVTGSKDPAEHDLVVNATPLGMNESDPLPMDVSRIAPETYVGEVVMKKEMTPFLKAVQARGCRFQVGTDMLFEQIPAYLEFFGYGTATPDELRAVSQVGD